MDKMHKLKEFATTEGQNKLAEVLGKHKFPESGKLDDVNAELGELLVSLGVYTGAPRYVHTKAWYEDDNGQLKSTKFTLRPSSSHELFVSDMKYSFIVEAGESFFDDFIREISAWFDSYTYHKMLQDNLEALNVEFKNVTEEQEIPFETSFTLGEGIVEVSDKHIVLGINAEVVEQFSTLPLFDEDIETRVDLYREKIADLLKECTKPYDIVKVKSQVTKNLGVFSRRAVHKMIRQTVTRKVEFLRAGLGYFEDEKVFAVVSKSPITAEQVTEFKGKEFVVLDNKEANAREKTANKTKLVAKFEVAPFNKETGEPVKLELAKVL